MFHGIKVLLDDYVLIEKSDTFVIAYTPDSREPAAWIALALRQRGFEAQIVAMRPLTDAGFRERLEQALPDTAGLPGRLVVLTLERDTMSHFNVFENVLHTYGPDRTMIVRIISASQEFFTKSLNVTPTELSALNASLLHRIQPAKRIRVKSPGGTDLTIEIDSEKFQWVSNRGMWRPGGFTILPAGEIATYPARVDGVLVADGAFNANVITPLNAKLMDHPARVTIENSTAVDLTCADPALEEMFRLCLDSPYGRNVGELGLGTNHGIDAFIPANSHINERRCGVHLGFGQHNQSLSRVPYVADVHLDLITNGALVWVDDDPEPIDLNHVVPSGVPHPIDALDEDITGDCCGLGYGELRGLGLADEACPVPGRLARVPR
ncbi:hypothetical protein [Sphaerisporangium perillae]|uniref:hypothetical protein n=1 Tax=Sphaerisporangium perillae TaxID=2935860 RepID=UPI00200BE28D|nr:hypothetical protein [Sphaerisporangium perillae]